NLEMVAVRPYGSNHHRLSRWRWRNDDRLCREVKRHAKDVGVFGVKQTFIVQFVHLPPKCTSDHLLAEQLRTESSNAKNVGDVVGVPALGEHGDGHDATDVGAELILLADSVHDLA